MNKLWYIRTEEKSIFHIAKNKSQNFSIEMSGQRASLIIKFGYDDNAVLKLQRQIVFPSLRIYPNNTHGSYRCVIPESYSSLIMSGGKLLSEHVRTFSFDGILHINSFTDVFEISRDIFPSAEKRCAVEIITVKNTTEKDAEITINTGGVANTTLGPMGINLTETLCEKSGSIYIEPGEDIKFAIFYCGHRVSEKAEFGSSETELSERLLLIKRLTGQLALDTGDKTVDLMFHFAKLRAGESIFVTKCGLIHSPGGEAYYASVWCNDECEYSGPWFAYTGDNVLLEAALNAYKLYQPFMGVDYSPIPSSIIAEGTDVWSGAGDRGDAAMYLIGACEYVLARGNMEVAAELWSSISWCVEYCLRKINSDGVVESDTDELEGRFPTGKANLATSCNTYGGLVLAARVAKELKKEKEIAIYIKAAERLYDSIDNYFNADIHGFNTYRYFKNNKNEENLLRSWICLPLCVDIKKRSDDTVKALTSKYLRSNEGLLTCEGCRTYWDRSLLYTLRGMFKAGFEDNACEWLASYSSDRLTGEFVPYAVEAYPEGNRRHLSAESALYCRVIISGLLGISPQGLKSFEFNPCLPKNFEHIYLKNISAFGTCFDIEIEKNCWKIISDGRIVSEGTNNHKAIVEF